MLRIPEDRSNGRLLDNAAGVHDGDTIRGFRDHAEIMRNEKQRQVESRLHLSQQIQNLGLNRHVQRGGRLVGDQESRLACQRDRDEHALPHPARQLMRVIMNLARRVGQPDRFEQLDGASSRLGSAGFPVDEQRFCDLIADGEHRVQRRHWLLENQRNLCATHAPHLGLWQSQQIAATEHD